MAKLINSIAKLMQSRGYLTKGSSANSQVGKYFNAHSYDDVPEQPHPNRQCTIEEVPLEPRGNNRKIEPQDKKDNNMKPAKDMSLSDKGIDFLKEREGLGGYNPATGLYGVYQDSKNLNTIGYGHLVRPGEDFGKGISLAEAEKLLAQDVRTAEKAVGNSISAPLSQSQFDAAVSLAYNIGELAFADSTIAKYINSRDYKSNIYKTPEAAWKAYNMADKKVIDGLVNRRNDEWDLYANGRY